MSAGRVTELRRPASHRKPGSCARPPGPGPRGAGAPPMLGLAFPEGRCHMAALSETRRRTGLPIAEGGGGRGWRVAVSLRGRQRRAHQPARRAAALPAGPFLLAGEPRLWRAGATKGSRPGPRGWDRVSCYSSFVLPRQVSLIETRELHPALSLAVSAAFKEMKNIKLSKWNCFFLECDICGSREIGTSADDSRAEPGPCT